MNAGNLSVSVEADMKALEASLAKMEAMFVESGKRAAVAFQQATGQIQQAPTDVGAAAKQIAEEFKNAAKSAGESFRQEITREMEKLPRQVAPIVKTTVSTVGGGAGSSAGIDFGKNFGAKGSEILKNFAAPMMAAQLAKTLAGIIRSEKPLNEAILDGIKQIPFVGAFAELGNAIYDATFGAADKAADDLVKKEIAARDEMVRAAREREGETRESQDRTLGLRVEEEKLKFQLKVNEVRKKGNEESIALANFAKFRDEQRLEFALMEAKELPREEFDAFVRVQDIKREIRRQELNFELEAIEKKRKAEEDAIKDRTQAEAEALREKNANEKRQLIKDVMKFEADQEKEVERLEQERLSAIEQADKESRSSARVGSVDTAIGEFKFSAYSDAERKKNDESTVEALRRIVSGIEEQIKITKEAVFS
jgi:hypothetical protein